MLSDCAFRAQLALPEQRMLFDYWHDIAGVRPMPARADFDPLKIPQLLPHLALIDLRKGADRGHFCLAGTRLRDIYGREITGRPLAEVFSGRRAARWRTIHGRVVSEALCAQGVTHGPAAGRDHVVLTWLRLPLSDDGQRVDRILCHDFAAADAGLEFLSEFTTYCAGLREPRAAPV